jgi:hypothetical protein
MPGQNILEKYTNWLNRKKIEQTERAKTRTKLLPEDLQAQILGACDREAQLIRERIAWIDVELDRCKGLLAEARAAERAAATPVLGRPGAGIQNQAMVDAHQRTQAIANAIERLKAERTDRWSQLGEIRRVKAQTETGLVSGLLAITQGWTNRVEIGGLADRIPAGRSYFVDAAGYKLPETALDDEGKPLPTPSVPAQRSNTPLEV